MKRSSTSIMLFLLPTLILIISTQVPTQAITGEQKGTIYDTAHDLGSAGNPTCLQCHTPHNATADYLWARTPNYTYGSGLIILCFSCHDGSITSKGWFIGDPSMYNHKVNASVTGNDCDRCHDPHYDTWKFISTSTTNATFCGDCHNVGGKSHGMEGADVSKYPPADYAWDPYASPPDFNGTRLWDSTDWQTWTKSNTEGIILCMTCHTPHGASYVDLTAMNSTGPGKSSPLCDNCH